MCKRIFLVVFLFVSFVTAAIADTFPAPHFKHIVIFGDSLSDNGNFYRASLNKFPPYPAYYEGRFSNGYVWSDDVTYQLYQQYGIASENYAVGGATAELHNPFAGYLPVTIGMQYDDYAVRNALSNKDNTLYILWIGANDYLPGVKDSEVEQRTTSVVNAIMSVAKKVAVNKGAQVLIIGLPDLASAPVALERHLTKNYQAIVKLHNQKLHNAIALLKQSLPSAKIMEFGFIKVPLVKWLVHDKTFLAKFNQQYHTHLSNVSDACLTGYLLQSHSNMLLSLNNPALVKFIKQSPGLMEAYRTGQLMKQPGVSFCQHPESHIFWDHMHPTSTVHKVLASLVLNKIMRNQ